MTDTSDKGFIWALIVLAVLICISFCAGVCWQKSKAEAGPLQIALATSEDLRASEQHQATVTQTAVEKTAVAAAQIHQQTQKVVTYVPYLITPDTVRRFPLPNGFVRSVDAAITGEAESLAASPSEPDDAASSIGADQAAITLAYNFGICREAIDRNHQWQAWAVEAGLAPKPGEASE